MSTFASIWSKGDQAFRQDELLQAISYYTDALKIEPANEEVLGCRSAVYSKMGMFNEAKKDADRLIASVPHKAKGFFLRASALENLGNYTDSLQAYLKTYELDSRHPLELVLNIIQVVGCICQLSDEEEISLAESEDDQNKFPKLVQVGKRLHENGSHDLCISVLVTALKSHYNLREHTSRGSKQYEDKDLALFFETREDTEDSLDYNKNSLTPSSPRDQFPSMYLTTGFLGDVNQASWDGDNNGRPPMVDSGVLMSALLILGQAYIAKRQYTQALKYSKQCLNLALECESREYELKSYVKLANVYQRLGDYLQAISYNGKLLAVGRDLVKISDESPRTYELFWNSDEERKAVWNLSAAYKSLGDYKKALEYAHEYLGILKFIDQENLTDAYGNMGVLELLLGGYEKALECHQVELRLSKKFNDKLGMAYAYGNMGNANAAMGKYKVSEVNHLQHLKIARNLGDRICELVAIKQLGDMHRQMGEYTKAIEYYETHLSQAKVNKLVDFQCKAFGLIGRCYLKLNQLNHAQHYFDRALELACELGEKEEELESRYCLAKIMKALRQYEKCRQYFNEVVPVLEHQLYLRQGKHVVFEDPLLDRLQECYKDLQEALAEMDYPEQALEISEHCKSRVLVNILRHQNIISHTTQRSSTPDLSPCTAEEIFNFVEKQDAVVIVYSVVGSGFLSWFLAPGKGVVKFYRYKNCEHMDIQDRVKVCIEELNGDVSSCYKCDHRSLPGTDQRTTVAKDGAYSKKNGAFSTKDGAYSSKDGAFSTKDGAFSRKDGAFSTKDCAYSSKDEADSNVNSPVVENTQDVRRGGEGESTSPKKPSSAQDSAMGNVAPKRKPKSCFMCTFSKPNLNPLQKLYQILIFPFEELLKADAAKKVFIVPDGVLDMVPFPSLQTPRDIYLHQESDISILPCLRLISLTDIRGPSGSDSFDILIGGNPEIPNVEFNKQKWRPPGKSKLAEEEVNSLATLLGVTPVTGCQATKEHILDTLSRSSVAHLVTYGSWVKGCLAFAPNPHSLGDVPSEDSYLVSVADLAALKVTAKVIVMSSCCSCSRKYCYLRQANYNLATAFLAAGAHTVVMPLWTLPQPAQLKLYYHFYSGLEKGKTVVTSLKEAWDQAKALHQYSDPVSWASHIVLGFDTTVNIPQLRHKLYDKVLDNEVSGIAPERFSVTSLDALRNSVPSGSEKVERFKSLLTSLMLQHGSLPHVLPAVRDLVKLANSMLAAYEEGQRLDKLTMCAQLSSDVLDAPYSEELLLFMGFNFQKDGARERNPFVVFPHWDYDNTLDITTQILDAVCAIFEVSGFAGHSLARIMKSLSKSHMEKLKEILGITTKYPARIVKTSDFLIRSLWYNREIQRFLVTLGFYEVGQSLLFNKSDDNQTLLRAALKIVTGLLAYPDMSQARVRSSLRELTSEESRRVKLTSLSPLITASKRIVMGTPWMSKRAQPDEAQLKIKFAKELEAINKDFSRVVTNSNYWHAQLLRTQSSPSASLPVIGRESKTSPPREHPVSPRRMKVKVVGGLTPSCNRRLAEEEPQLSISESRDRRNAVYKVYAQRYDEITSRKRNEIRDLFTSHAEETL